MVVVVIGGVVVVGVSGVLVAIRDVVVTVGVVVTVIIEVVVEVTVSVGAAAGVVVVVVVTVWVTAGEAQAASSRMPITRKDNNVFFTPASPLCLEYYGWSVL